MATSTPRTARPPRSAGGSTSAAVWASIKDFSAGVQSRLSGAYPPGAADPTHTWGCWADKATGILSPLPCQWHFDVFLDPAAVTGAHTNLLTEVRVLGIKAVGPVIDPDDIFYGIDSNQTSLFAMLEFWYEAAGSVHRVNTLYRYNRHRATTPLWDEVWRYDEIIGTSPLPYPLGSYRPVQWTFHLGRTNTADPTKAGHPVLAFAGDAGRALYFPDETTPTTNSTASFPGDLGHPSYDPGLNTIPVDLALHQGRAIIAQFIAYDFGPNAALMNNEVIYFTGYNDFKTLDVESTFNSMVIGPEHPSGYAIMASLTASELLLVKRQGGAILITGDIGGVDGPASPNARTLPYVQSPGLAYNNGTIYSRGLIYPVDTGGVWSWQGGDFSEFLSPALAPDFWRPTPVDRSGAQLLYGHANTSMDANSEFVLVPNDYLFEPEARTWWRTESPETFIVHHWSVDWRGRKAYAATTGFRNFTTDPVFREYDLGQLAGNYQWQSQPFSPSDSATTDIRELAIVASGTGTIEVTVFSSEDSTGVTRTFTLDNVVVPLATKESIGIRGSHFTIRVRVKSDNWDTEEPGSMHPAPFIHEIRYAFVTPTPLPTETVVNPPPPPPPPAP
jgi:hypothetical protein